MRLGMLSLYAKVPCEDDVADESETRALASRCTRVRILAVCGGALFLLWLSLFLIVTRRDVCTLDEAPWVESHASIVPHRTLRAERSECSTVERTRVLITGISGLIGSHVAHELVESPGCKYDVYGLVRPRSDLTLLTGILSSLTLIEGEITDAYRMLQIVEQVRPHHIYHFAAQAINSISSDQPELTVEVNVQGTLHLLEALRVHGLSNTTRLFLAGSSTEYGHAADSAQGGPLPETSALEPVTPYGVSKVAAEMLARQYFFSHQQHVVIGRLFIQIGPGGTNSLAIQQFCKQIAMAEQGLTEPVIRHGNLATMRDISDVRTTAPIIIELMERGVPGEAYNIGTGKAVSMQTLLDTAVRLSHVNITTRADPQRLRAYDEKVLLADTSKLRALVKQTPNFFGAHTIAPILDYWRAHVARLYPESHVETLNCSSLHEVDNTLQPETLGCPFADIDIMIPVAEHHFPLMAQLMATLEEMMPCYGKLILLVDTVTDAVRLRGWVHLPEDKVLFHYLTPIPPALGPIDKYIYQSEILHWADTLVSPTAKYVMSLDTDVVFTMPITCKSLFDDEGRVYMPYTDLSHQLQFVDSCEDFVGHCVGSWMIFFPMLFPVSMFAPLREHVLQRMEFLFNITSSTRDFMDIFGQWARQRRWQGHSQYVIAGNYLYLHQRHLVHPIFHPILKDIDETRDAEALNYVAPALHWWRPCGYTDSCTHDLSVPNDHSWQPYTGKFSLGRISMVQEVAHHGHCIAHALSHSGALDVGCTAEHLNDTHIETKVYQARQTNMSYIAERYAPEVVPSQLCSARIQS